MKELSDTVEQLVLRVDALEQRVRQLEGVAPQLESWPTESTQTAIQANDPLPVVSPQSGGLALAGRSLLGIAGAFLLRALSESAVLPHGIIAAIAIAYAIGWQMAAARAGATRRLAALLYAVTSAIILAPMLWELTMRFSVMSAGAAAGVLILFVSAATAMAWRRTPSPDITTAYVAAALTGLALSVVTRMMWPFIGLSLCMLAVTEFRRGTAPAGSIRAFIAIVADCQIWILLFIYRAPTASRPEYPILGTPALLAPSCGLFLLAAISMIFRVGLLHRKITVTETVQGIIAFLLLFFSIYSFAPGANLRLLGTGCLLFAGLLYGLSWGLLRNAPNPLNFYVFSTWGGVLFAAGICLCTSSAWASIAFALAAIASAVVSTRICCQVLELHGVIFLAIATATSGLWQYVGHALAGSIPREITWVTILVVAAAWVCQSAVKEGAGEKWRLQLIHFVLALVAGFGVAALLIHGSVRGAATVLTFQVFHLAFLRTLVLCLVAVGLALAGARWRRLEMTRVAYLTLILVAAKLVFEDLRSGHLGYITASISLFAVTLISVPRLVKIAPASRRISSSPAV